jgi:transposase-like protein
MDKRKVLAAYRRGMITKEQCAQILGIDSMRVMRMVSDSGSDAGRLKPGKQSINS